MDIQNQQNDAVPQTSANRPHDSIFILNRKAIGILTVLIIGNLFFSGFIAGADDITSNSLLECSNLIRKEYVDKPLYFNEKLNHAAEEKLKDMQEYGYWAHQNPVTKKLPWDFVDEAGYYYQTTGENLAIGFTDSQSICNAWANSPEHLKNIKDPSFQEVGFAVDKANLHHNGKGILVVQIFGSRNDFSINGVSNNSTQVTQQELSQNSEPGTIESGTAEFSYSHEKVLGATSQSSDKILKYTFLFVISICYLLIRGVLIYVLRKRNQNIQVKHTTIVFFALLFVGVMAYYITIT